jgi:hypothetical protein
MRSHCLNSFELALVHLELMVKKRISTVLDATRFPFIRSHALSRSNSDMSSLVQRSARSLKRSLTRSLRRTRN